VISDNPCFTCVEFVDILQSPTLLRMQRSACTGQRAGDRVQGTACRGQRAGTACRDSVQGTACRGQRAGDSVQGSACKGSVFRAQRAGLSVQRSACSVPQLTALLSVQCFSQCTGAVLRFSAY
jgi:hypothetical protein